MAKDKVTSSNKGCVLYVDGGCRAGYPSDPDSKYGGWGIHGYTYELDKYPKVKRTKKDTPTIKGYLPGEKVELTEQVDPIQYIDAHGMMTGKDSSDRAELAGFKNALDIIKDLDVKKAHLLLDNQYVIYGVGEGYEKWSNMNWKKPEGGNYANQEIWQDIMSDYYPLQNNVNFTIDWVNGHSGNLGNDRADYLATKGVYKSRNGLLNDKVILISDNVKYRQPKPNINRLFAKSRWYFNTIRREPDMSEDGRYVYHCGAHGSDDTLVGKPMSDSVACVIFTKEQEKVLEAIRQHHMDLVDNPLNELCMARLNTILLPRIYDEIEKEGTGVLSLAPRKLRIKGLCTIDEQEVTKIIQPSGLTFKLIETHNFMAKEFQRYLDKKCLLTDITEHLYTITVGKKKTEYKYKPIPSDKVFAIPVHHLKDKPEETYICRLSVGIDIPSHELMKAIAERNPKVYVTTWTLSEYAFRYAVIIDLGDDAMIWMGKDSSMQFVYPEEMKKVR